MPACKGILSTGKPCPKVVKRGQKYCQWHDPEDESWSEIYVRLADAEPEAKTNIVLDLIESHPEHKLILPIRNLLQEVMVAQLFEIDLSRDTLDKKRKKSRVQEPIWISITTNGINLDGANLQGANLEDANLQYGDFDGANLQNANLFAANLQSANFMGTDLQNATLFAANLQGADFLAAKLQHADLGNANVQSADFHGANLDGVRFTGTKLQSVDLSSVESMFGVHLAGAWLDRTRIRREQLGNAIGEELEHEYSAAKSGYLALKQNFDDLGDYEAASWAYRKERQMEKLEAFQRKRYLKFLSDTFIEWLCDYGENAGRVVGWLALLLLIVGPLLFGGLGGIVWNEELGQKYFAVSGLSRLLLWYRVYLLYTLDTLTTASFSGLQPINDWVKLFSGLFAILGVFLAGLLGFVAGNRIRRS